MEATPFPRTGASAPEVHRRNTSLTTSPGCLQNRTTTYSTCRTAPPLVQREASATENTASWLVDAKNSGSVNRRASSAEAVINTRVSGWQGGVADGRQRSSVPH